jgi:orotate phosphoribosyltransferase
MIRTPQQWIQEYVKRKTYWVREEKSNQPHVVLRSRRHSNGFFNSRPVIVEELLLRDAAADLLEKYAFFAEDLLLVDGVVGPATGATALAQYISDQVAADTRGPCFHASPTKQVIGGEDVMVFSEEERKLLPGKWVLLCEDVFSTGGSIERTIRAIEEAGGKSLSYVLVLVNRSGLTELNGRNIIALIEKEMPTWPEDDCPLCKGGSKPIMNPKDNWRELIRED